MSLPYLVALAGRRLPLLAAAIILAVASFASSGQATIRYGGDSAFAPFEYLDESGRARGFQIDLLDELGREIGVAFVVSLKPWAETEADFRAGRVDAVAMVDTERRQAWARFAKSHATPAFALYRLASRPEPQGWHELAGWRIAVPDSEPMRETIATELAQLKAVFDVYAGADLALAAVQRGEADAALFPRAYADRHAGTAVAPDVVAGTFVLWLQSYAFAFAPDNADLRERVQRGLDALERSGRLEALRVRWLSSHRDRAVRERLLHDVANREQWAWTIGGASLAALAGLGTIAWIRGRRYLAERNRRRAAEAKLDRAFGSNPAPMLVVERDTGAILDANAAVLRLLGVQRRVSGEEPLRTLAEHVDAGSLAALAQALERAGALDAIPVRVRRIDGTLRDCLVNAEVLSVGGDDAVFCVVRDVTEDLARDATLRDAYQEAHSALASAQRSLADAREGKTRAEESLQEFTRSVSHDLRAPINAVIGFSGLLRQRLRAGRVDEAIGYSERIELAAQRMNEMIGALAGLARVSRDPLIRQPVDMNRLVHETWAYVSGARPDRPIDCRVDRLPVAHGDPEQISRIWQNLLDNALKYTGRTSDARIGVDSFSDARGTWYRVTDNGAGFDMANAQSLFLPFRRMHRDAEFPGTGVGLSLVKRIVDRHGGEIRIRSTPDVGTIVEFTLDPPPAT